MNKAGNPDDLLAPGTLCSTVTVISAARFGDLTMLVSTLHILQSSVEAVIPSCMVDVLRLSCLVSGPVDLACPIFK